MDCIREQNRPASCRQRRLPRFALMVAGLAAIGSAVTACGGPSAPGVATGPTATTASSPAQQGRQGTGLLAYSSCMRSHGVPDFPDPTNGGGIPKNAVIRAFGAVSASRAQSASKACGQLLPGGSLSGQPDPTVTPQQEQYYLRAAACMRAHGITNFPDPIFPGGHVELPDHGNVDTHSAHYAQANQTCRELIPAGLPDSDQGR